jgi:hypothetical protein
MPITPQSESNGANLGFAAKLWLPADKLRINMDAAERLMEKAIATTNTRF